MDPPHSGEFNHSLDQDLDLVDVIMRFRFMARMIMVMGAMFSRVVMVV